MSHGRCSLLVSLLVTWLLLAITSCSRVVTNDRRTWDLASSMPGPRSTHDVLLSIEERLKALDTFGYAIRLANLDHGLEQLTRRLGDIEGKLDRLESKLDNRMEKMQEVVVGKDLKEGVSIDQLLRRVDSLSEKVGSKLGLGEARMSLGMENLGMKIERSERHVRGGVEDLLNKLVKSDERRAHFESQTLLHLERIQTATSNIQDVPIFLKELADKMDSRRTGGPATGCTCESLEASVRELLSRPDLGPTTSSNPTAPLMDSEEGLIVNHLNNISAALAGMSYNQDKRLQDLDTDVKTYGRKVLSMSQDILRETKSFGASLIEALDGGNQTRNLLREGFRKLHQQIKPVSGLDEPMEAVRKKVSELSETVDTSFATLLVAQNTFIGSCHRIQQQEPEIEIKIYNTLQKIMQDLNSRTETNSASTKALQNSFEVHTKNFGRALNDLVWTVITVGNETSQDVRRLGDRLTALGTWPLAALCQSVNCETGNTSVAGGNVPSETSALLEETEANVGLGPLENIKAESVKEDIPTTLGPDSAIFDAEKAFNQTTVTDYDPEYYD